MPMFNKNGIRAFTAWDNQSAERAKTYDINGNILIDNSAYSIDEIVSYYKEPMQSLMAEISELSSDWQNVIFITDMHGTSDNQHSQAIAIYMAENLQNIDRIILGGDYALSPFTVEEYNTYMQPFLMRKIAYKTHVMYGNHEAMGSNASLSKPLIAQDFVYPKSGDIIGEFDGLYYYFDVPAHKTRWMILNTSNQGVTTMDNVQKTWIANNVVLPDTDWNLIVFGHINLSDLGGIIDGTVYQPQTVIDAIKQCNGNIIGYICGHQHIDDTRNIGDFQQTTLLCDKFENVNWYDGLSVTNRVVGTVSEQAITIISINTNTRQVVCRRLGAGWEDIINGLHYTY